MMVPLYWNFGGTIKPDRDIDQSAAGLTQQIDAQYIFTLREKVADRRTHDCPRTIFITAPYTFYRYVSVFMVYLHEGGSVGYEQKGRFPRAIGTLIQGQFWSELILPQRIVFQRSFLKNSVRYSLTLQSRSSRRKFS